MLLFVLSRGALWAKGRRKGAYSRHRVSPVIKAHDRITETRSTTMAESSATVHAETLLPFVESDSAANADTLRAAMAEQGYLFFRRLVPDQDVLAARQDVLALCHAAGWLDPLRDLLDAVVGPGMQPTTEGQPAYMAVYRKVLKLPSFHNFPCHP